MRVLAIAVLGSMVVCPSVAAQGNGHGNAYGHYKNTVASAASAPAPAAQGMPVAGTGVRNFGSWLDDASLQDPGHGFLSLGMSLWRTPDFRGVDFPTIDTGVALNRRVQFGMTVPYYHAGAPGEPVTRGLGDMYFSVKYQLRAPSPDRTGFAVIPMLEVLSVAPPAGGSRVQWALPASVERQFKGWRVMGTGGYFSRGALFGAGAVEVEVSKHAWATGALSHSYSTPRDDLSAALGFHRSRTDVSGGLTYEIRPNVSVYGSLGRTISARDTNSATLVSAFGVTFGLRRW